MKSKVRSTTTATRLSNSHVLNTSSLNNTHIQQMFDPKENYFTHNIQNSESKQVEFLRHKNRQLEVKVARMVKEIEEMEYNKQ